jgi:hypothetical protein
MNRDDELRVRPGRTRTTRSQRAKPFIAEALAAAEKAGGMSRRGSSSRGGQAPSAGAAPQASPRRAE